MNVFIAQAKNGYYLARAGTSGNNYYLTSLIDKALQDNPKKLNNICSTIPKHLQSYKPFKIISYNLESKKTIPLDQNRINLNNIKSTVFNLQTDLTIAIMKEDEYSAEQSVVDQQINDILHYIEFHRFSASEGYKLCKKLQELRDKRRDLKNRIAAIHIFKTMDENKIISGCTINQLENIENKIYIPRQYKKLFMQGKNRERQNVKINYDGKEESIEI